jgi:glycosyltransferase involved in cell wall biosynthesis
MTKHLTCCVITPVGPGHETLYENRALPSIKAAIEFGKGCLQEIKALPAYDLDGKLGRSKARNDAVRIASREKFDWIFFLDADDFLFEQAFVTASKCLEHVDALWGLIYESSADLKFIQARPNQLMFAETMKQFLDTDPYLSLQMGHFVRTDIALKIPFDESMNCGEDFKYYLSVWSKFRCKKIPEPLFLNIRGTSSTGPKSANGRDWNNIVGSLYANAKKVWAKDDNLDHSF